MNQDTNAEIFARWSRNQDCYIAALGDGYVVYSDDGDNWADADGRPAGGPLFEGATITLCDGPRNGVSVC